MTVYDNLIQIWEITKENNKYLPVIDINSQNNLMQNFLNFMRILSFL